ncbi:MAG: HAD family hydrolase [Paludibacteraceae bacterium]
MSNVVLIDICGTLFCSNTTFDFLDYYVEEHSYRCFRKIMHSKLWRYANSLIYRLLHVDLSRRVALSYLKGKSRTQLYSMAEVFYNDYLLKHKNEAVWQLLQEFRAENAEIVLVSATIDPVAQAVAHNLGVEHVVSSHLNYDSDQKCRGKLAVDVLRSKSAELRRLHIYPPYKHLVTDNPGDMDLVAMSESTTIIVYGHELRWNYLTHGFKNVCYIHA